jgi:AGZA family xanthine/uracil permease-like MFS transporter
MSKEVGGIFPKFVAADLDAALGVFFDGFTKVLVGVAVLGSIMPDELYGTIVPGLGITTLIWGIWLSFQAKRVSSRTGSKVTALPGGLNAGRFFIWLFAIMLPTLDRTGDVMMAWKAGIGANLIGAIIFLILAPFLGKVMKIIPRPAVFGALAGGAAAWLLLSPMAGGFEKPEIFLVSLFALLIIHFGKLELKFSASSIAIGAGVLVGWALGYMSIDAVTASFDTVGVYVPLPMFGLLSGSFSAALPFLPIIIAFSFTDVISAIQSVEQGIAGGDEFSMKESVVAGGLINIIGSLFGNPFPIGYYWGHPAWKRIGAGTGYPIITGVIYLVLCSSGLVAIATSIIPVEATYPLLVFAALITMAQAFEINEKKYYGAMAIGLAIPIYELMIGSMKDPSAGYIALSKGSMFIAIIYSYVVCTIIDRDFKKGAYGFILAAVLSSFGLMHLEAIAFPPVFGKFTILYLGLAAVFFVLDKVVSKEEVLSTKDQSMEEVA